MKDLKLWKFIYDKIIKKGSVVLYIVAETSNSSPGKQGFKMAVTKSGEQFGTIGGGIMEAKVVKDSTKLIGSDVISSIHILHHDPKSDQEKSGLICGGSQTVITKILGEADLDFVEEVIEKFKHRSKCLLYVNQNSIKLIDSDIYNDRYNFNYTNSNKFSYKEICGISETAYIIGGGHVGLAVSKIISFLDFYVVNIDHRPDVFTFRNNEYANQKIICEYNEAGKYIDEGEMSYVVIVTSQHTGDKAALKSVIDKNVKYIGMMGSKRKIDIIFSNLEKDGVDRKVLIKVHTPIGLEIEAESPEEIAVSIAAEIIRIKNSKDIKIM
ncbi:putative xanthine dehydrogenase subunit A [bacterium BMS3Abin04]|nr:putative xanthine dehydrogenase subunit A [bacterium BMS3Abin04]